MIDMPMSIDSLQILPPLVSRYPPNLCQLAEVSLNALAPRGPTS